MTSRVIERDQERDALIRYIEGQKYPFTARIESGRKRSVEQNKLQRLWIGEIADQLDSHTREEWRGYCKLTIGVPILREENEKFRKAYDENVRGLPYETKLAIMMEPLDMPTTRIMTMKQKVAYLDGISRHFADKGVVLTEPKS